MNQDCRVEDLVRKAQAGCRPSFDRLVDICRPKLEPVAYFGLGPAMRREIEVEDILQDVFLRAYKAIPTFRWSTPAGFFHWLDRITQHVIVDNFRKINRQKPRGTVSLHGCMSLWDSNGASLEPAETEWPSPAGLLSRHERFEWLEKALASLRPAHREVIILARIRKLPMQEIALRMGRTTDAASMLLGRALKKLKEALGETSASSLRLPARSLDPTPAKQELPPRKVDAESVDRRHP
jgi:RNA polymerase sigma factor (sigma-70 family)